MEKIKDKLPDASKWCHIYTDSVNVTTIHDTENNETYRIIPNVSAHGFMLEYHKDGELKARNGFSFEYMKILAKLAGSNNLLKTLNGGETLSNDNIPFKCPDCGADLEWIEKTGKPKFIKHN